MAKNQQDKWSWGAGAGGTPPFSMLSTQGEILYVGNGWVQRVPQLYGRRVPIPFASFSSHWQAIQTPTYTQPTRDSVTENVPTENNSNKDRNIPETDQDNPGGAGMGTGRQEQNHGAHCVENKTNPNSSGSSDKNESLRSATRAPRSSDGSAIANGVNEFPLAPKDPSKSTLQSNLWRCLDQNHCKSHQSATNSGSNESTNSGSSNDGAKNHGNNISGKIATQPSLTQSELALSPAVFCDKLSSTLLKTAATLGALSHIQQQEVMSIDGFKKLQEAASLFSQTIGAIGGPNTHKQTNPEECKLEGAAAKHPGKEPKCCIMEQKFSVGGDTATHKQNLSARYDTILEEQRCEDQDCMDLDLSEFVVPEPFAVENMPQPEVAPKRTVELAAVNGALEAKSTKREGPPDLDKKTKRMKLA